MPEPAAAMGESNKATVRRIYEGYNKGDTSVFDELYQPGFVHHSKTIHDVTPGTAGEAESMILAGQFGDIGPDGGVFDVETMVLFRFADGKGAEEWLYLEAGTDL